GEQDRAVLGQQQNAVDRTTEHPLVDGGEELVVTSALHRTLGIRGDEEGLEHVDRELAGVPVRVGLGLALQVRGTAVGRACPDEGDQGKRDEDVSKLSTSMPPIGHGCPRPCVLPRLSAVVARDLSAVREALASPCLSPGRAGPPRRYADRSSARARKARPRWLIRSFSSSPSSAIVRRSPSGTKIGS